MDVVALGRMPWVGEEWDLIDLQVNLRGGEVSGSLLEEVLRLQVNDHFRVAVAFFDPTDAAVDLGASRVRWSLRESRNEEVIFAMEQSPAVARTDRSGPYYLFEPDIKRFNSAVRELGEAVVNAVADVDWMVGGKVYSSRTFAVAIELDGGMLVREAPTPAPSPVPTTPTTPTPPPPLPPAGLTEEQVRALFNIWIRDVFPDGAGFPYVQDGDVVAIVAAGDCTTGEKWSPNM